MQLEFNFFDWKKYEAARAKAIADNIPPDFEEKLLLTDLIEMEDTFVNRKT